MWLESLIPLFYFCLFSNDITVDDGRLEIGKGNRAQLLVLNVRCCHIFREKGIVILPDKKGNNLGTIINFYGK